MGIRESEEDIKLCRESDEHFEKIQNLEEYLISQGFRCISTIRETQFNSSMLMKTRKLYECLVYIPGVDRLTEEASKQFKRKYITTIGTIRVYALPKNNK